MMPLPPRAAAIAGSALLTRSRERAEGLASVGAEPVVRDVYDAAGLEEAVRRAAPEVVVHQLTALPPAIDPRRIEEHLAEDDWTFVVVGHVLVTEAMRLPMGRSA